MDTLLFAVALAVGLSPELLLGEIPFDFVRKRVTVVVADECGTRLVTKGAFHHVLEICTRADDGTLLGRGARADLAGHYENWAKSVGTIAFCGQARLRLRMHASPGPGAPRAFVTSPIRQPGVPQRRWPRRVRDCAHRGPEPRRGFVGSVNRSRDRVDRHDARFRSRRE